MPVEPKTTSNGSAGALRAAIIDIDSTWRNSPTPRPSIRQRAKSGFVALALAESESCNLSFKAQRSGSFLFELGRSCFESTRKSIEEFRTGTVIQIPPLQAPCPRNFTYKWLELVGLLECWGGKKTRPDPCWFCRGHASLTMGESRAPPSSFGTHQHFGA